MAVSLIDRVLSFDTLHFAWRRVEAKGGKPGGDGISLARFAQRIDANLLEIIDDVRAGAYRPGTVRMTTIRTGANERRISILPVRDRVLQRAALDVLTPVIDPTFLSCSFGYRPNLSIQDAVARIVDLRDRGLNWVIDADIRNCFGSLDHRLLARFLAEDVHDHDLCKLLTLWIAPPRVRVQPRVRGIPLGAPISPLFCNFYLHRLDESLRRRALKSVRYADDFVVFCKSGAHAEQSLRSLEKVIAGLNLTLNLTKTRLTTFDEGFDFLGVHFEGSDYRYEVEGIEVIVDTVPPDWFFYHADTYE
jgi:group II intron reverse transcriptase/maturase